MQIFNTSLAKSIMRSMNNTSKSLGILGMQLSTGNRLISPAVDAAGFAIANKMQAQIRGLEMASRNTQDAMSLLYVADGALSNVDNMLIRIKELTVQASSGTNEESDIEKIQMEINELLEEIKSTGKNTEFNGKKLFDGSSAEKGLWIQTGANSGQGTEINLSGLTLESLGLDNFDFTGKTHEEISGMINTVDKAISSVTSERSKIGAKINRFEFTLSNLDNMSLNLSEAHSRIADTDMAKTMMEYTKEQIKMQASMAMLSKLFEHERQMVSMLLSSL